MPFRNSIRFILSSCTFQISTYPWKMKGSQNLAGMASFSPRTLHEHNEAISCNYVCSKSPINFLSCCSFPIARVEEIRVCSLWPGQNSPKSVAVAVLLRRSSCSPGVSAVWGCHWHPGYMILHQMYICTYMPCTCRVGVFRNTPAVSSQCASSSEDGLYITNTCFVGSKIGIISTFIILILTTSRFLLKQRSLSTSAAFFS